MDTIEGYLISPQQEHIWCLRGIGARSWISLRFEGPLDASKLYSVLRRLAERHESLRASFPVPHGLNRPLQVLRDEPELAKVQYKDPWCALLNLPNDNTQTMLPLEFAISDLGSCQYLVSLRVPAMCCDESSLLILAHDWVNELVGREFGRRNPVQYLQFSQVLQELRVEHQEECEYWERMKLPSCDVSAFQLACTRLELDSAQKSAVGNAIGCLEGTSEQLWLAAWLVCLARSHDLAELCIGIEQSGRPGDDLTDAVGPYSRFLPLNTHVPAELTCAALLAELEEAIDDLDARQLFYAPSPPKVLPYVYGYARTWPSWRFGDLQISVVDLVQDGDTFEFRLRVVEVGDSWRLELFYNGLHHLQETAMTMLKRLIQIAASFAAEKPISRLDLLTPEQRHFLLVDINRNPMPDMIARQPFHRLFEECARREPKRIALILGDEPDQQITYAELNLRVRILAGELVHFGVGPEQVIALYLEPSVDLIAAILAISACGAMFLPLEVTAPAQRLAAVLADSRPSLVLACSQAALPIPIATPMFLLDQSRPNLAPADELECCEDDLDRGAYVIYTSGSTGQPKGVIVSQRNLAQYLLAVSAVFDFRPGFSYAVVSSLATDLAGTMVYPALCKGGTLHVLSRACRTDGAAFAAYVQRHRIDCLKITPSHLAALWEPSCGADGLPVHRLILGGEAAPRDWVDALAQARPDLQIHNHYGPTETTVGVVTCALEAMPPDRFPVGHPLPGSRIYLVDGLMEPVALGLLGELLIGGAQVARGYLGQPAQTALRFVPDPFSNVPGARLYRSGDLGRFLGDGVLFFEKRLDRQLKIRGYRVEPGEIETLLRRYPGVRQAAIIAYPATRAESSLVAFTTGGVDGESLRVYLDDLLPDYMRPHRFIALAALPLMPNGKLDRRALFHMVESEKSSTLDQAETLEERVLWLIWSDVLGQNPPSLDATFFHAGGNSLLLIRMNNRIRKLFAVELGLDALFAAATLRTMARLVAEAKPDPSTLDRLASALHRQSANRDGSEAKRPFELGWLITAMETNQGVVPLTRGALGSARLSFAQQRLWFLQQAHPESPFLNNPYAVRIRGKLDVLCFERAFFGLQSRHETLRTRFSLEGNTPCQWIQAPQMRPLALIDLSGLGDCESQLGRILTEETKGIFDLAEGPVWRYMVFRLGANEQVLALTMHHICSDGWSMRILVRDLSALYSGELSGIRPDLAELPIQYADYAEWQRDHWANPADSASLEFWRQQLQNLPQNPPIALDHARSERRMHGGALLPIEFSAESTSALLKLSEARQATLFMVTLSAFYLLLHAWGKSEDLVVGTDLANREREEVEGLIGFFVNQLVLRINLAGDPTLGEVIERVRARCLECYAHQEVPFDLIVKAVTNTRDVSQSPLFSVKFFLEQETAPNPDQMQLVFSPVESRNEAARLDLTLGLWWRDGALSGWFSYDTDLIEAETVAHLASLFAALIDHLPAHLDQRMSLFGQLFDRQRQALVDQQRGKRRRSNLDKLQRGGRRQHVVSGDDLLGHRLLAAGQEMPLVLEPNMGPVDLALWLADRRELWSTQLKRHGALLFRGFGIDSVVRLQACIESLLISVFRENSEHQPLDDDGAVQTPVAYAADRRLLWHNENTFNRYWPTRILFACAQAASAGGATPLVDGRKVYQGMDPELRAQFERSGILYQRNYYEALGLSWQQVFQTQDRAEVEAKCREQGMTCEWRSDGHLRTLARRPALGKHPQTCEWAWWAQPLHWHLACLDPLTRTHFEATYAIDDLPRHCFFGDGQPIADEHIAALLKLHQDLEISTPWEQGDLILVDNLLASHGRLAYSGTRKLLVSMGDLIDCETLILPRQEGS